MNVSSCSNSKPFHTNLGEIFRQRFQDFKALGNAIQSNDLPAAQTAFAAVQKDIQESPRIAKSAQSDQINNDLAAVEEALTSGDADAARQALDGLAQSLRSLRHCHHPRPMRKSDDSNDSTTDNVAPPPTPVDDSNTTPIDGTLDVTA